MDKRRKKEVMRHLETAKEAVGKASTAAGPVSEADDDSVVLCVHIGQAVYALNDAIEEVKK
jgi:hypothetical protein